MTRYTSVKVNISDGQKEKLQHDIKAGCPAVSIRLGHEDLQGNDILAITNSQAKKLAKAHENGKGITIRMSSSQLKHNTKIEGGFLGLLAGLAARASSVLAKTFLPALGVGALSGLASTGVQKAMGSGLYLKKGELVSQVETDGHGLYLKPYKGKGLQSYGDGLYLKHYKKRMNIHKFNVKPKTIPPKTIHWRPLREVKYPALKVNSITWEIFNQQGMKP